MIFSGSSAPAACVTFGTLPTALSDTRSNAWNDPAVVYPGHYDQALRTLLDRMVKDGIEPDTSLERAVVTVAYLYATIGGRVGSSD